MGNFDPEYGEAVEIRDGIRRLVAPNPSPMTYTGTNTYILGRGAVAVVDPGPENEQHLRAILAALHPADRITHILVTHSHVDHSPLARPLADRTGAKIYAYGDSFAGRSETMQRLAQSGLAGGKQSRRSDRQTRVF